MGYYDYGLGAWIEDEYQRKKIMKQKGLEEVSSLEEVARYTKKQKELTEDDFRAMVADSMMQAKHCRFTKWRMKQQSRLTKYREMEEAYEQGRHNFSLSH